MNLLPNKNSNPDLTVLAVATFMMKVLRKKKFQKYGELYDSLEKYDKRATSLFNSALGLLYLFGVIEYHSKNDLIEWVNR
ncbi:Uncharacterised protein [Campylobacter jejuni]|nr:Uncharacterised protein [Campylobacter jejuni]